MKFELINTINRYNALCADYKSMAKEFELVKGEPIEFTKEYFL